MSMSVVNIYFIKEKWTQTFDLEWHMHTDVILMEPPFHISSSQEPDHQTALTALQKQKVISTHKHP